MPVHLLFDEDFADLAPRKSPAVDIQADAFPRATSDGPPAARKTVESGFLARRKRLFQVLLVIVYLFPGLIVSSSDGPPG